MGPYLCISSSIILLQSSNYYFNTIEELIGFIKYSFAITTK